MNRISVLPARALAAAVPALVAVLVLAACGSSSPSAKTSAGTSTGTPGTASTGQAPPGQPAGGASRFDALRECLKKQGITLPQRVPGGKRPRGGAAGPLGLARPQLPSGVSRARYEAALKKCGGFRGGRFKGLASSPAFSKALEKFAACMRQQGIPVPNANTSGKGPIFDTKGIDTASSKFKAAETKCISLLRTAQPGAAQAPGGAPPGGAPPAGG